MKALVIPDTHLKPAMFEAAGRLMERGAADRAVCLGDLVDDWGKEYDTQLYEDTMNAAIEFAKRFPDSVFLYGNHELAYRYFLEVSGQSHSPIVQYTVIRKLRELEEAAEMKIAVRIERCLFSHAGITNAFVRDFAESIPYNDVDAVIEAINASGRGALWSGYSPIWARPQGSMIGLYGAGEFTQIAGHTPVERVTREGNLISCDVFSTYRNGDPIGTRTFPIVDCATGVVTEIDPGI